MTVTNSEIISFYNGQNIFLTGATGFVGKLVIDQLLRKCDVNKVYLLIRPKKGLEPKQRTEKLFQDIIYERLRNEKPDFIEKVEILDGDLSQDNLGLSEENYLKIIEKTNIVIHGGATVRFDEIMRKATAINVKGTLTIVNLCHKIKHLKAFVYISTAFSNCVHREIKEEFYDPPIACDELMKVVKCNTDEELETLTPKLLGKWPNSYAFSKAIAEDVINKYAKGLPASVFRPAIIIGTDNEPIPGWIDNVYGPTGILAGTAAGIIRVIKANPEATACIVPADMVAAAIVAAVYKTSLMGPSNEITIYNYVTEPENPLTWHDYMHNCTKIGDEMPVQQSVWRHSCSLEPNPFLFTFYSFLLHYLPALLIDLTFLILGKKQRALKAVDKVSKFMKVLSYFSMKSWKFSNNNLRALWIGLNSTDKELFQFDMKTIDWSEYFKKAIPGIRLYIFKEAEDTIPDAIKRMERQQLIQTVLTRFVYCITACLMWKLTCSFLAINQLSAI